MSAFEFVTVLISIILGLGITQILSGVADMIQQWDKIKIYWVHLIWVVLIFILHVQEWWLIYQLRDMAVWRLPPFLFQILYPISLFIAARILFPSAHDENNNNNMKDFYYNNYRKFFLIVMILSIISSLDNIFFSDVGVQGWIPNVIILVVLLMVAAKKIPSEWLHQLIAVGLLLTFVIGIIIHMNEWLIVA